MSELLEHLRKADFRDLAAFASVAFGLISLALSGMAYCFPVSLIGIILGLIGLKSYEYSSAAKWGLGFSIFGLISTLILLIVLIFPAPTS